MHASFLHAVLLQDVLDRHTSVTCFSDHVFESLPMFRSLFWNILTCVDICLNSQTKITPLFLTNSRSNLICVYCIGSNWKHSSVILSHCMKKRKYELSSISIWRKFTLMQLSCTRPKCEKSRYQTGKLIKTWNYS